MTNFSKCVHCGRVVANSKYTCELCHSSLCENHRQGISRGAFSSKVYRCIPTCPNGNGNGSTSPPAATASPSVGGASGKGGRSAGVGVGGAVSVSNSTPTSPPSRSGGLNRVGSKYTSSSTTGGGADEYRNGDAYSGGASRASPVTSPVSRHPPQRPPSGCVSRQESNAPSAAHAYPTPQHSQTQSAELSSYSGGGGNGDGPQRMSFSADLLHPLEGETNARQFVMRVFQLWRDYRSELEKVFPQERLKRGLGQPLADATPLKPGASTRRVYFSRLTPPVDVDAEMSTRKVRMRVSHSNGNVTDGYGTILGYLNNDTVIVWHERGDRFASRVPLSSVVMLAPTRVVLCRHCGCVFQFEEQDYHVEMHKKGGGQSRGTIVNDPQVGMACGDTELLLQLYPIANLGAGAQGEVKLCERLCSDDDVGRDDRQYVTKQMRCDTPEEALAAYQQSVRLMSLRSDHLVEYLAVQLAPDKVTIQVVMLYYSEGDLSTMIRQYTKPKFNEGYICSIALQLLNALSFLQERNPPIIHGDIKPENILMFNERQQVLLMDLDASKELDIFTSCVRTDLGTTAWMAPEALHRHNLMPASDMWSLGAVLYVFAVLPEFPMIEHPLTKDMELLNSLVWQRGGSGGAAASPQPSACTDSNSSGSFNFVDEGPVAATPSTVTLRSCVKRNIRAKKFSKRFASFVADLLDPEPAKRPQPATASEEVTEIMMEILVDS